MGKRDNKVLVSLDARELVRLDELRGAETRAAYLPQLLHEPPSGSEVATHSEAMAILTRLARDGRTIAAIALEKTLRGDQPASELEDFLRGG